MVMKTELWSNLGGRLGVAIVSVALMSAPGTHAVAEQTTPNWEATSSNVLVSTATAQGTVPTQIKLNLLDIEIPPHPQLELVVEPLKVTSDKYVVVVSSAEGGEKQLGTFAFFPPPREGNVQKFLVDAEPVAARIGGDRKTPLELSIKLVPVSENNTLAGSSVRILGARLVGG
jgi:hypothetical protein